MILAAACFARSSPRLHDWLWHHRVFGPAIRDWRRHGAIPRWRSGPRFWRWGRRSG
ncbi:YbaN family protein [Gemmobacter lanyuensis]